MQLQHAFISPRQPSFSKKSVWSYVCGHLGELDRPVQFKLTSSRILLLGLAP